MTLEESEVPKDQSHTASAVLFPQIEVRLGVRKTLSMFN